MKNSNVIIMTIILSGILIISANAGLCVEDIVQTIPVAASEASKIGTHGTVSKFIVTMIGVVLSSIIIWGGLTIYNKIFVYPHMNNDIPEDEERNTPKTIEDAVTLFIKRNRMH